MTRFERAISTSQMWRGTSSATPGYSVFAIIPRRRRKSKIFLSVVNPVVKAAFQPGLLTRRNPVNARVARLSGLPLFWSWMESTALPKQARYQLRYTRLLSCFIRLGVFTQTRCATKLRYIPKLRILLYAKSAQKSMPCRSSSFFLHSFSYGIPQRKRIYGSGSYQYCP